MIPDGTVFNILILILQIQFSEMRYFIGVDVGTGSVRAALVKQDGKLVATASKEIRIWNPKPDFYQQSSEEIWSAVRYTMKVILNIFRL